MLHEGNYLDDQQYHKHFLYNTWIRYHLKLRIGQAPLWRLDCQLKKKINPFYMGKQLLFFTFHISSVKV